MNGGGIAGGWTHRSATWLDGGHDLVDGGIAELEPRDVTTDACVLL